MSYQLPDKPFPDTPPLPAPGEGVIQAEPWMFQAETADSFHPIAGFDASEMRDVDYADEIKGGKVRVSVLRAKPGIKWVGSPWHMHHYNFSIAYIIKGWADFEFEGVGPVRLSAGTIMHQPAMNRHREGEMSEDFEAIVYVSPPVFGTTVFTYNAETGAYDESYIANIAEDEEFGKSLEVAVTA